jgi:hypothetical protein
METGKTVATPHARIALQIFQLSGSEAQQLRSFFPSTPRTGDEIDVRPSPAWR